jgi:hypothetical protein
VFNGVGRIVEIPAQPGDPRNVSRDDLVYPEGTMHLVNTTVGFSSTLNPHSCMLRATLQENSQITGGTGLADRTPMRGSYGSFASFRDPNGNEWLLKEITQYPPRDWWNRYAPYLNARLQRSTPAEASVAAGALHGGTAQCAVRLRDPADDLVR